MKQLSICTFLILFFYQLPSFAQKLKPGFDKEEYTELLKVCARHGDSLYFSRIEAPRRFHFVYRSADIGLDNCWHLWTSKDSVAVISVRGSTKNMISWIANFYAAMLPAKGAIMLGGQQPFEYKLSDNPRAAVHAGWLIGMAYLAEDMLPKIDSCYKEGIKNILLMGHSQGGAITYLLNSYLHSLQQQNKLPRDIIFKTYCSASPKPGNTYYAYEYEAMTQGGWAYNVVNSADWVPQTPVSVQTVNDYNRINPFVRAKDYIGKMGFPKNIIFNYFYGRLSRPTIKAQKRFERYMGDLMAKQIKKHLPGFAPPEYVHSADYVRTGNTIVLLAKEDYYRKFSDNSSNIFIHHFFEPYLYLAAQLP